MSKKTAGETVLDELKTIQRIQQISSSWENAAKLLEDGIHSVQEIFELGENKFVDRYSKGLGGVEPAMAIYLLVHRFLRAGHPSKDALLNNPST